MFDHYASPSYIQDGELYYFAHPYSENPDANYLLALSRTSLLLRSGIKVISPIVLSHYMADSLTYSEWLEFDIEIMKRCDGIIVPDGWEQSGGCVFEIDFMIREGKPVFSYDQILISLGTFNTNNTKE